MRRTWVVIKREYLFRVRKKSFVILTLLGPLLITALYSLPVLFMKLSEQDQKVAVVDLAGGFLADIEVDLKRIAATPNEEREAEAMAAARSGSAPPSGAAGGRGGLFGRRNRFTLSDETRPGETKDDARRRLNQALAEEQFDAYLIIGPAIDTEGNILYGSRSSGTVPDPIERALTRASVGHRSRAHNLGLSAQEVQDLTRRAETRPIRVNKAGQEVSEGAGQQGVVIGLVFGMVFIYYLTFLIWGSAIMTGVIEEKSSRIVEVLMSSVTPTEFMAGKVIGMGLVAFTQLGIWAGSGLLLTLGGSSAFPEMARLMGAVDPALIVWFLVLFPIGYAMYSFLYAACGAMCNNVQEAQQAVMPVTLIVVMAFFVVFGTFQSPDSGLATWASIFPLTAPIVLLARLGLSEPPLWQVALSVVLQLAGVAAIVLLAARIFRVGMLMYGKRPTLPELWRWVRTA